MKQLMRAVLIFIVLSLMTGLAYPLVVTGLAELFFPWKASGSLITDRGRVVGSALIGQKFTKARYFHGRPSANDYDASNSGGTNFGPASAQFIQEVKARVEQTRIEDNLRPDAPIPADLVLASGSGLDPDISVESASIQIPRVAKERAVSEEVLKDLVARAAEEQGGWVEPRVNVLRLNMATDRLPGQK